MHPLRFVYAQSSWAFYSALILLFSLFIAENNSSICVYKIYYKICQICFDYNFEIGRKLSENENTTFLVSCEF